MKRLLDFARDFSKQRAIVNRLTAIKWEWEILKQDGNAGATSKSRVDLLEEGLNLRDGIMDNLSGLEVVR
jgi:hypothetical protein